MWPDGHEPIDIFKDSRVYIDGKEVIELTEFKAELSFKEDAFEGATASVSKLAEAFGNSITITVAATDAWWAFMQSIECLL